METLFTDVLIIGGGPSASMAALTLQRETDGVRLIVATPISGNRDDSPALLPSPDISWERRFQETLLAGAGQNDPALVRALCREAPTALNALNSWNQGPDGDFRATLQAQTSAQKKSLTALRLLVRDGRVQGALCVDDQNRFVAVSAGTVLIACGGYGDICRSSSVRRNGGDAIGMAYYAGAAMSDLEFIWFSEAKLKIEAGQAITLGGLIIDDQCRTNVTGLLAAGGCTAGVHGAGLLPGNEILAALAFGQIAGHTMAHMAHPAGADADALATWAEETVIPGSADLSEGLLSIRRQMEAALHSGAGPIRDQASVEAALQTASHLQHELNELPPCAAGQWAQRLRLENDLIAARLTLLASMERRESIGLYRRSDHPETAKKPYRIRLQLTGMLLFPEKEALPTTAEE